MSSVNCASSYPSILVKLNDQSLSVSMGQMLELFLYVLRYTRAAIVGSLAMRSMASS